MKKLVLASLLASLTGCASIVSGTSQSVSIDTARGSEQIQQATCKLENGKGTWFAQSPGSVVVHRSYSPLVISCTKDGYPDGIAQYDSSTIGMAAGNILFGGAIGIGVDMASGAAYEYPNLMHIEMGQNIKPTAKKAEPSASATNMNTKGFGASGSVQPAAATAAAAPTSHTTPMISSPDPTGQSDAVKVTTIRVSAAGSNTASPEHEAAAEQLAREAACANNPEAKVKMRSGDVELISVACDNGDDMIVQCDGGSPCHAMSFK